MRVADEAAGLAAALQVLVAVSRVAVEAQARHSAGLAAEQVPQEEAAVQAVLQPSAAVAEAVVAAVKAVVSASLPTPPVHHEQVPKRSPAAALAER